LTILKFFWCSNCLKYFNIKQICFTVNYSPTLKNHTLCLVFELSCDHSNSGHKLCLFIIQVSDIQMFSVFSFVNSFPVFLSEQNNFHLFKIQQNSGDLNTRLVGNSYGLFCPRTRHVITQHLNEPAYLRNDNHLKTRQACSIFKYSQHPKSGPSGFQMVIFRTLFESSYRIVRLSVARFYNKNPVFEYFG
jgi:hypothetical protein